MNTRGIQKWDFMENQLGIVLESWDFARTQEKIFMRRPKIIFFSFLKAPEVFIKFRLVSNVKKRMN